jgi:hypothetical protein
MVKWGNRYAVFPGKTTHTLNFYGQQSEICVTISVERLAMQLRLNRLVETKTQKQVRQMVVTCRSLRLIQLLGGAQHFGNTALDT